MGKSDPAHDTLIRELREISVDPVKGAEPDGRPMSVALWPVIQGILNYFSFRDYFALVTWLFVALYTDMFLSIVGVMTFIVGLFALPGREVDGRVVYKPGFYYQRTERNEMFATPVLKEAVDFKHTPWIHGGDLQTLVPFLIFKGYKIPFERRWLETEDGETIATDWAFPEGGYPGPSKVLLILHGLNGGSGSQFVSDTVHHANKAGITVVVMVARGNAGTPIKKWFFNAARVSDVHLVTKTIRKLCSGSTVLLAGYSMGAVVAANYLAKMGEEALVDGAVCISGCFDCWKNCSFTYATKSFHTQLAYGLKCNVVIRFRSLLEKCNISATEVCSSKCVNLKDFDTAIVVPYYGYKNVKEYYDDVSAGVGNKLDNVARPLLVVSAVNDPIIDINTFPLHEYEKNENLLFLFTSTGGHVGWPVGWNPMHKEFNQMTCFILDFFNSVHVSNQKS